jgi:hypothetical protein
MDPRTKAIDDVREIFSRAPSGPPPRVCPSCGAEHATNRAECPSCGKRYDRRFARVNDTQRWILAGVALLGVIVAAVLILPGVFSAKKDNDARVAREQAARVAAERKRLIREQRPMRGRPDNVPRPAAGASAAEQIAARHKLVTALEGAILVDAQARVKAGDLDGPVKRDVIKDGKVVGLFGHPFVGTADFKRWTYVWCKDNKVPGERGKPLAKVPIPAVCIGAEGRPRVGDGYLSSTP